jgi:hypothetical protein
VVFHWGRKDSVAIIVINNHHVVVAIARWGKESSGLIRVDLPCRLHDGGTTIMDVGAIGGRWGGGIDGGGVLIVEVQDDSWLGGALILPGLVQVPCGGCNGAWRLFA